MKHEQAQTVNPAILDKLKPIELPPLPKTPLVSVLIANYNYGKYIGEAIESVLSQTYQNFEIVICDDGSIDNSLEVIEKYTRLDKRVKYIAKENGGVASALNASYRVSKGDIICLLDADDIFSSQKLELIVSKFLSNQSIGFVIHPLKVIDECGKQWRPMPIPRCLKQGWIAEQVIQNRGVGFFPPASGLSFRRTSVINLFPIPEDFRKYVDGYLAMGAAMQTKIAAIEVPLSSYRIHTQNITGIGWANPESIITLLDFRYKSFSVLVRRVVNGISVSKEEFFNAPVFSDTFLVYRLQTGKDCPLKPYNKSLIDLLLEAPIPKRYVYYLLLFLPPALNRNIIRFWHENRSLKIVADKMRILKSKFVA